MKRMYRLKPLLMAIVVCGIVITAAAWQSNPGANQKTTYDTIPDRKIRDIDDAIAELERAKAELERTISDKSWERDMKESMKEFDAARIKETIENAMKQVDAQKIQMEAQKALSEMNMEKIQKQMKESMEQVDSEKIRQEIAKAMEQVNSEKLKSQIEASLAQVDMEKIRAQMEKFSEVDLKRMEEELSQIGPRIEESMKDARESIEKAKVELLEYKEFIGGLEKDGLINKDQSYEVKYENGELEINGKKQSAELVNKYQNFLNKHKEFTIRKDKDGFNINKNNR